MQVDKLLKRKFNVRSLRTAISGSVMRDLQGHSANGITAQFKSGAELISCVSRIDEVLAELQKARNQLMERLECPAGEKEPTAFGLYSKDGTLSVFAVGEYEPEGLQQFLRLEHPYPVPLYTEQAMANWTAERLIGWGYRNTINSNAFTDNIRQASSMQNVGYPVPLFSEDEKAAWLKKPHLNQFEFIQWLYAAPTDKEA